MQSLSYLPTPHMPASNIHIRGVIFGDEHVLLNIPGEQQKSNFETMCMIHASMAVETIVPIPFEQWK